MPIVSIIIPCYNQANYLSETLDSVVNQTYQDWECIIINDGSSDNTEDIAKKYCANDSRFFYIYQDNHGVVAARNNAISQSHGKYILPLDGDDIIHNRYLEVAVKVIERDPKLKLVCCECEYIGEKKGRINLPKYSLETLCEQNCFVCTSLFRRIDFDRIGGYNDNMKLGLEDWDFWLSLLESGGKVYRIPEVMFYYRKMQASRNNSYASSIELLRQNIRNNHLALFDKMDKKKKNIFFRFTRRIKRLIR